MTDYEPLGKYRFLAELGKGGFATVYRAEDTTLEREVALKVLDPLLLRDGAWVARLWIAATLCNIIDAGQSVFVPRLAISALRTGRLNTVKCRPSA